MRRMADLPCCIALLLNPRFSASYAGRSVLPCNMDASRDARWGARSFPCFTYSTSSEFETQGRKFCPCGSLPGIGTERHDVAAPLSPAIQTRLDLHGQGLTDREIADRLDMKLNTVTVWPRSHPN